MNVQEQRTSESTAGENRVSANGQETVAPPSTRIGDGERVSVTYGDRLCASCHYNLIGQPVLREPHYDMLIVRCPECATVASMQEYPQLGRWANRWAVVLSGIWLVIILGVSFGSLAAMTGMSGAFTEETVDSFEDLLNDHWAVWYETNFDTKPTNSWRNPDKFDEWLATGAPASVLAQAGGRIGAVRSPETFLMLVPMGFGLAYGVFAAVAMLHRRRRTLFFMALGLLGLGGFIYGMVWWAWIQEEVTRFDNLAWMQVGLPLMATTLGAVWLMIVAGTQIGRPVTRGLVRLFLPPRLRTSLAVLWTTDGLMPPLIGSTPA